MKYLPVIFENVYRNMSDGVIAFDEKDRIIFVNRTAERILTETEASLLNTDIKEVFAQGHIKIDDDGFRFELKSYVLKFI